MTRTPAVPVHRGPQAYAPPSPTAVTAPYVRAPNAALLIDFDNVTMGVREDLHAELRTLLSSDIIKGKVAVQRAYADWRRYPSYVVPLTESSIDLIYAPAYGSSKKNATDIRLAIDALELVFTRPEIGTFILLSGDSDFSSLVIKLKEYGKYVIGVGIRESSSDLLVMNCDEYYSYNALAGLVKSGDEETVKHDPWELVVEAVQRMKRNGDVMRADRLKQVMQEIDSTFDEKDLGMAKFSRFVQEAAQRGLLTVTRLDNGQYEIDVAGAAPETPALPVAARVEEEPEHVRDGAENGRRSRRGRGGRGRRGRETTPSSVPVLQEMPEQTAPAVRAPEIAPLAPPVANPATMTGERLTRDEAFNLVRRALDALVAETGAESVLATDLRDKARTLLGRDSETLSDRFFPRILRDMHDADLIDLRKHGETWEVSPAIAPVGNVDEQLTPAAESAAGQAARTAARATSLRRGIRPRGVRPGAPGELPPELLTVGVVAPARSAASEETSAPAAADHAAATAPAEASAETATRGKKTGRRAAAKKKAAGGARRGRGRKQAAAAGAEGAATNGAPNAADGAEAAPPAEAKPAAKKARRPRARKKAAATPSENEA
ncbi:MAG TPA: NYN domain-containing protein [Gemmatimonadaceae bacterium]|nr:NYN domain-containing protein [Gemmatimonadaceae bacterium]